MLEGSVGEGKWKTLLTRGQMQGAALQTTVNGRDFGYDSTMAGLLEAAIEREFGDTGVNYLSYSPSLSRVKIVDEDGKEKTIKELVVPFMKANRYKTKKGQNQGVESPLWEDIGFTQILEALVDESIESDEARQKAEGAAVNRALGNMEKQIYNRKSATAKAASRSTMENSFFAIPHRANTSSSFKSNISKMSRGAFMVNPNHVKAGLEFLDRSQLTAIAEMLGQTVDQNAEADSIIEQIVKAVTPGSHEFEANRTANKGTARGLLYNVFRYPLIQQGAVKHGEVYVGNEIGEQEVISGHAIIRALRGDFDQDHIGLASVFS